jgi:hypothetical protein
MRDESAEEREEQAPEAHRDEVLERAAKELGVTYEELRSTIEY